MKVADFISRFRAAVFDDAEPPFWSSEEIVSYLNEAVQEACERAFLIEDRSTPSICEISLQSGMDTYSLHPSVFQIKRLTLRGRPLEETSVEALDAQWSSWETSTGQPREFIFEQASGIQPARVRLVPTPAQADAIFLSVYRGALKPLNVDLDQARPEVPERFHDRLLDWVMHRAYLKQDADTFDPAKAIQSLALFTASFGERPDANVQRKQRDRQPPLVRSAW